MASIGFTILPVEPEGEACETAGKIFEWHHLYPKALWSDFLERKLFTKEELDEALVQIEREAHKIIHGKGGGEAFWNSWNELWKQWLRENPEATREQAENEMKYLARRFGIKLKL